MRIDHYISLYFMWENSDLNMMKLIWISLFMSRSSTGLVEPAATRSPPANLPSGTSNLFFKTTRADLPVQLSALHPAASVDLDNPWTWNKLVLEIKCKERPVEHFIAPFLASCSAWNHTRTVHSPNAANINCLLSHVHVNFIVR